MKRIHLITGLLLLSTGIAHAGRDVDRFVLADTPAIHVHGIDRINHPGSTLIAEIKERLNVWQASSPKTVGLVREALNRAPLYYTEFRIAGVDQYIYEKGFGVLLSMKDFNRQSAEIQMTSIVLGSLRHVQVEYGMSMSEFSTQKIAAALILKNPSVGESLDSSDYADGALLKYIERKSPKSVANYAAEVCPIAKKYQTQLENSEVTAIDAICQPNKSNLHLVHAIHTITDNMSGLLPRAKSESEYSEIYDDIRRLLGIASNAGLSNVDSSLMTIQTPLRGVQDATLLAQHVALDVAIDEANTGGFRKSAGRSSVRVALENLVKRGTLQR
jgi:hypothetical protein